VSRAWAVRAVVAVLVAGSVNLALTALDVRHDGVLVALLAGTTVAAGVLALEAIDTATRLPWTAPRRDARPEPGEDTRTAMYRHVVEAHLTSREADDTVLWQLADLGARRLRQVHGFRAADDPARAEQLLGSELASLVMTDRRHRHDPAARHRRCTVAELGEVVRRIEAL
jgi:hypothetical protein